MAKKEKKENKEEREELIEKCPRHKGIMTNYSQPCTCGGIENY